MKHLRWSFAVTASMLFLTACGGGSAPITPQNAVAMSARTPLATMSTAVTATRNGRPVQALVVTLSRQKVGGPVIARGTTKPDGKVVLSGFTSTEVVCAWGVITSPGRRIESSYCAKPFPSTVHLDFST